MGCKDAPSKAKAVQPATAFADSVAPGPKAAPVGAATEERGTAHASPAEAGAPTAKSGTASQPPREGQAVAGGSVGSDPGMAKGGQPAAPPRAVQHHSPGQQAIDSVKAAKAKGK
jgi:hypothetical protein